jgi:hypothetical protein
MKSYRKYILAAAFILLALCGSARAQSNDNDGCSNSTLKGDYAFTISGQIFNQNGTFTQVNGIAMTNFDGEADAQGKATINFPPLQHGLVIQLTFVLSNQGRKIHAVVSALTAPTPGGPVTIPAAISAVAEKVSTIRRERD